MKYAVLGAGAVGSTMGAFLAIAGKDVWLVDPNEVHMNAIKQNGLLLQKSTYADSENVSEVHVKMNAVTIPELVGKADVVILMVKGMYTESAIPSLMQLVHDGTVVLTLQNGLGNTELLSKHVNPGNIAYGITGIACTLIAPGVVHAKIPPTGQIYIGSDNKMLKEKLEAISEDLKKGGCNGATYTNDIKKKVWEKLAVNASSGATCGIVRLKYRQAYSFQSFCDISNCIVEETIAVAAALGIQLDDQAAGRNRVAIPQEISPLPDHYTSLSQDIINKRPTEVDYMNGAVVREGKKVNVPTPYNELIWKITKVLEQSYDIQF